MKRLRLLAALILGLIVAVYPTGASAGAVRTAYVSGSTPYLHVIENDVHGRLLYFCADYPDQYLHCDLIPASNPPITDLEHYTCLTGGNCSDYITPRDPETIGYLGQAPVGFNHGVWLTEHPAEHAGYVPGGTLVWQTFEHGPHEGFYFEFADGFWLHVIVVHPIHYFDIALSTQPTTATSITHADQTPFDTQP